MTSDAGETQKAYQAKCPSCKRPMIVSGGEHGRQISCPHANCQGTFKVSIRPNKPEKK